MTSELPAGWARAKLGEVVERPRPKSAPADDPGLPFVGMDSIAPGGMSLLGVGRFGDMKSAGGIFEHGDVLYGRMRPYLNKVHRARRRGACSVEFIVMPPSPRIDGDFLAYLLHHRAFVTFASEQSSGDRPRVDFQSLASFEFAMPPKPEQQRIVSRIEELFSEIDEGERGLERSQKLVARYGQSVLQAAITGDLTREWRKRRPASSDEVGELIEQLAAARRSAFRGTAQRYVEPVAPDPSGLSALPEGWQWVTVEQLCFVETGATPRRGEAKYYEGGTVPWVTSGAVNEARISEATELITERAVAETNAKIFPAGTLLVAMYGEGKTRGKVSELGIDAATN